MDIKEQLVLAEQIAHKAHEGQFRHDGKTPYIEHPKRVAELLTDDEDKIVAWLHDVIEDTDETPASLLKTGLRYLYISKVNSLTKWKDTPYFRYITSICGQCEIKRIKVADIVANLTDSPTEKQIRKYTKALTILTSSQYIYKEVDK